MPYIQADLGKGVKITFQVFVCMVAIAAVAMQVNYISTECGKTNLKACINNDHAVHRQLLQLQPTYI